MTDQPNEPKQHGIYIPEPDEPVPTGIVTWRRDDYGDQQEHA